MKKILNIIILFLISLHSSGQEIGFIVTEEVKEQIDGLCNPKNVFLLNNSFDSNQVVAVCAISDSVIEKWLNEEINFLKERPKYDDHGTISITINCKGKVVQCKTSESTKSTELDEQILKVVRKLKSWKAGKIVGKEVDSVVYMRIHIEKGKITIF